MTFASVCAECEYSYGAMGRIGYLYQSTKDQLRWKKLSVKKHIKTVMGVGRIMALRDEDYMKQKVKAIKTPNADIASALIAAFGDGK